MKLTQTTLDIVALHYPNVNGILLTGSQLEPDRVTKQSDIDVVLLGEDFNGISTHVLVENNQKYDFTKLGINDLYRIMIDASYDRRGVLLHMVETGKILKDDFKIFKALKKMAAQLYQSGNPDLDNEIKIHRNNLSKLRKNFSKDLDPQYQFFLTLEYTQIISNWYVLSKEGWFPSTSYRRTKQLLTYDKNGGFIEDLMQLTKGFFESPEKNKSIVMAQIDRYLVNPFNTGNFSAFHSRFIVNFKYKVQTKKNFLLKIAKAINAHPYLKKLLLYKSLKCYNNVFAFPYVLVFDNQQEAFNEHQVLSAINEVMDGIRKPVEQYKLVSGQYLLQQFREIELYNSIEPLLQQIDDSVDRTVFLEKKYDNNTFTLIACSILSILARSFGFTESQLQYVQVPLLKKWQYDGNVVINVDYKTTKVKNKRNLEKAKKFHAINGASIEAIKSSIQDTENTITLEGWDFLTIQQQCNAFVHTLKQRAPELNPIDTIVLNKQLHSSVPALDYYYFVLGAEFILNTLKVEKPFFQIVAFAITQNESTKTHDKENQVTYAY